MDKQEFAAWNAGVAARKAAVLRLSYRTNDPDVQLMLEAIKDYENGITWQTTCLHCAKLMDTNYTQYCQIQKARASAQAVLDTLADYTPNPPCPVCPSNKEHP